MTKKARVPLELEIGSVAWGRVRGLRPRLRAAAELTLASLPAPLLPAARRGTATLLLTTDARVQKLNRAYRGIDKPTNVLSFPFLTSAELRRAGRVSALEELHLGDIAIAYGVCAREARAQGKELTDHVVHLTIHGLLHLFGYDHHEPRAAARMERMEMKLMLSLGLLDPYAWDEPVADKRGQR